MGLVAVTAALFTLGAYLARTLPGGWGVGLWIASLGCLLAINRTLRQSTQLTLGPGGVWLARSKAQALAQASTAPPAGRQPAHNPTTNPTTKAKTRTRKEEP